MKTCTVYVYYDEESKKQEQCGHMAAYKGKSNLNGETKEEYFCLSHMPGRLIPVD